MAQSSRKLAETAGVSQTTIMEIIKKFGYDAKNLTDEQEQEVIAKAEKTAKMKRETDRKLSKKSNDFKASVRRIDMSDESSVLDMLQDCKEEYVKNQELIQRLRHEIDQQDSLMNGNGNGTLSAIPQLTIAEKYLKINISLRNQIVALEEEVGRRAEPRKEDDPFE